MKLILCILLKHPRSPKKTYISEQPIKEEARSISVCDKVQRWSGEMSNFAYVRLHHKIICAIAIGLSNAPESMRVLF
jgi:hypothetical protein